MSKSRIMGAGNAGASRYLALNGNNGGGSKKQGLPPSVGRKENDDRSYGTNRNVVFYMNQLGGVGKGKSMFSTNADGVHNPIKSTESETQALTSIAMTSTENTDTDTVMDGVLLLTCGNMGAYNGNGGSRLILVQMDDTISLPTSIVDTDYSINNNSDITNVTQLTYTSMDTDHTYRQSYAASDPTSVKYVTLDCSDEITIKNTVNLSLTRPGVVTTHYLVPMNYNTSVTGSNNTSTYEGTSYSDGSTTFKSLANALQDSDGIVSDNLIAEYGMGYNDAQGIGLGSSIEIDLFEMTPCSMATTLHGALFNSDNTISSTDTNGAFCNIHGASAYTDYSTGSINAETPNQTPDGKYVQYTYTKDGVSADVTDVNKYGPGTDFGINTLKNIEITNTIRGYAYSEMGQLLVDANIIDSVDDYSEDDGWMQMTTTLTQGTTEISMTVLSQGFPPGSGVENINYIMSLWMRDNNYWLDGQEPGDETDIVRGWVDYYNYQSISQTDRDKIIDSDTYDSLDDAYKSTEGYTSLATDGGDLSDINPSICLFSDMSITDINTDNVTYAVSLDVMFRAIDDDSAAAASANSLALANNAYGAVPYTSDDFSSLYWSAQYAISYGVHYSSELTIDGFDGNGETPGALDILVKVPSVTADVTDDVSTNYKTAMGYGPWDSDGYPYSPDPGSYLTNTTDDLPDAVSGTGGFRIPANQPVYMVFSGLITSYTEPVEDLLSSVLPTDGVNYVVLK